MPRPRTAERTRERFRELPVGGINRAHALDKSQR